MRMGQKRYSGDRTADGSVRVVVAWADAGDACLPSSMMLPPPPQAFPLHGGTDGGLAPVATFDWGRDTAGGRRLAWALLCDCLDADHAHEFYREFEWSVVRGLPIDAWELDESSLLALAGVIPHLADERARLAAQTARMSTPFHTDAPHPDGDGRLTF